MKKRISIGALLTIMAITATVTFSLTMVFSTMTFNDKLYNIKERESMYKKISEIDGLVRQNYYGAIDEEVLMDSIARGYVTGIGEKYGMYLDAKQYSKLMGTTEGTIVGIGVQSSAEKEGYIRVKKVYTGSTAEEAGVLVDDMIVKVDDVDISKDNVQTAIDMLNGEAGTKVNIVIRRDNTEIPMEITRRYVQVQTVQSRQIGDVGYVQITEFGDNTADEFSKTVDKLMSNGAKGLVFDLRNNLGGTLESVTEILDKLLPEGTIVTAVDKNGKEVYKATSDASEVDLPMVVLTNGRTASASELFAQALKDYNKAKTVGTKTLGKGVMQTLYKLNDGSALDITVAKFNPPSSPNFDGVGVKPDYEVTISSDLDKVLDVLDETTDPQLKKALEVVSADIKMSGEAGGDTSSSDSSLSSEESSLDSSDDDSSSSSSSEEEEEEEEEEDSDASSSGSSKSSSSTSRAGSSSSSSRSSSSSKK